MERKAEYAVFVWGVRFSWITRLPLWNLPRRRIGDNARYVIAQEVAALLEIHRCLADAADVIGMARVAFGDRQSRIGTGLTVCLDRKSTRLNSSHIPLSR